MSRGHVHQPRRGYSRSRRWMDGWGTRPPRESAPSSPRLTPAFCTIFSSCHVPSKSPLQAPAKKAGKHTQREAAVETAQRETVAADTAASTRTLGTRTRTAADVVVVVMATTFWLATFPTSCSLERPGRVLGWTNVPHRSGGQTNAHPDGVPTANLSSSS